MDTRKLFDSLSVADIIIPYDLNTWVGAGGVREKFDKSINNPLSDMEKIEGIRHQVVYKDMYENKYHRVIGSNKETGILYCFSFYNRNNEYGVEYIRGGVDINNNNNKTLLLV